MKSIIGQPFLPRSRSWHAKSLCVIGEYNDLENGNEF